MDTSLVYKIAFASLRGINAVMARELMARLGCEEEFFRASGSRLAAIMGFRNRFMEQEYRGKILDEARREYDFVCANSITRFIIPILIIRPFCPIAMTRR